MKRFRLVHYITNTTTFRNGLNGIINGMLTIGDVVEVGGGLTPQPPPLQITTQYAFANKTTCADSFPVSKQAPFPPG